MSERVKVARICEVTGMSVRQVQAMAAAGKIPSAAQLGKQWTFREEIVRRWVRNRERKSWRKISTNEERSGGAGSQWTGPNIAEAYEQFMSQSRGHASKS